MVTMGFGKQLRSIADNTRPDRQTLVWLSSRTMDANQLIEELTSDCVMVKFGAATHEDPTRLVEHIVHVCDMVEKEKKLVTLLSDVLTEEDDKAIVFVERKQTVGDIVSTLCLQGWAAVGIHGTKTEEERESAINDLRFGNARILVATDVAASALAAFRVRFVVSRDYPEERGRILAPLEVCGSGRWKGSDVHVFSTGRNSACQGADLLASKGQAECPNPAEEGSNERFEEVGTGH
ncbi:hypothetical protein MTO96_003313 [Rhipicephalus appendiculatus]